MSPRVRGHGRLHHRCYMGPFRTEGKGYHNVRFRTLEQNQRTRSNSETGEPNCSPHCIGFSSLFYL
uniref:Uncharacterized protein n=1 Tax=Anguilla anguilla TaxID=7936 RepID=A0A0E9RAJ1_ANGAN